MPPVEAKCPKCNKPFGVLERQIGTSVHCPHCGQRMKISGPQQKKPADAQDDAIAQMFGPAPAPKPKPEAKPVAMARPAPAAGTTTRFARNLGLDEQPQDHLLDNAPVRSRTIVWVWLSILAVIIVGLSIGLYSAFKQYDEDERAGRFASQQIQAGRAATPTRVVSARRGAPAAPPMAVEEVEQVDPADASAEQKDPLVLKWPKDSYYVEQPKPTDVWVIGVENVSGQIVRRVGITFTAIGADSKKQYGVGNAIFRDVQPGETLFCVFEHPYIGEVGGKGVPYDWQDFDTDRPVYKFEVRVRKLKHEGGGTRNGTVVFEVTNLTEHDAPAVDVQFILYNKQGRPAGYARAQVLKVGPGKTVEGQASWKHAWDTVDHVGASRAQIADESGK